MGGSFETTKEYKGTSSDVPGGIGAGYAVYYNRDSAPRWRDMTAGQTCDLDTDNIDEDIWGSGDGNSESHGGNYPSASYE
jgi:hypothetical protein